MLVFLKQFLGNVRYIREVPPSGSPQHEHPLRNRVSQAPQGLPVSPSLSRDPTHPQRSPYFHFKADSVLKNKIKLIVSLLSSQFCYPGTLSLILWLRPFLRALFPSIQVHVSTHPITSPSQNHCPRLEPSRCWDH